MELKAAIKTALAMSAVLAVCVGAGTFPMIVGPAILAIAFVVLTIATYNLFLED